MFILSNKSIFAAFAMAACMTSSATAGRVRSKDEGLRGLKGLKAVKANGVKADRAKKISTVLNEQVTVATQSLPITTNVNTVSNDVTIDSFKEKCPSETDEIYRCAAGTFQKRPEICMMCIMGQVNLPTTTVSDVLTCKRIGGNCRGCEDEEILKLYNCGANGNLMVPGMTPPVVVTPIVGTSVIDPSAGTGNTGLATPIVDTPVIGPPVPPGDSATTPSTPVIEPPVPPAEDNGTTPSTPVIGPPITPAEDSGTTPSTPATDITTPNTEVTVEINSISDTNNFIEGPPPDASYCPIEDPAAEPIKSGDGCDTKGYEYLQCYYPGKVCSCYAIQPLFSCIEQED